MRGAKETFLDHFVDFASSQQDQTLHLCFCDESEPCFSIITLVDSKTLQQHKQAIVDHVLYSTAYKLFLRVHIQAQVSLIRSETISYLLASNSKMAGKVKFHTHLVSTNDIGAFPLRSLIEKLQDTTVTEDDLEDTSESQPATCSTLNLLMVRTVRSSNYYIIVYSHAYIC